MDSPPFTLHYTSEANSILDDLSETGNNEILRSIRETGDLICTYGPEAPGPDSYKYMSLHGAHGEEIWESAIENSAKRPWRMYWMYGPTEHAITVLTIGLNE